MKDLIREAIRKALKEASESPEDQVDILAKEYLQSKDELERFMIEFGHIIEKHKTLTSAEKKKLDQIEKMMIKFKVVKHVVDKMVFEIVTVPKNKLVRADLKPLLEQALDLLSIKNRKIIKNAETAQVEAKRAETKDVMQTSQIDEEQHTQLSSALDNIINGMQGFAKAASVIQKIQKA